jgi:N-acyl-D-aspartate/D-glutamate deacylase/pimeloyl-ACP methyl ester carboxylesterase
MKKFAAGCVLPIFVLAATTIVAEVPPYDVFPPADPPYYRVRYEASTVPGELSYPVNYTVWIPPHVEALRGVIVHQHGCGVGSCKSGLTGAYDLHWQALAKKHACALLAPAYEQPEKADCQMWCDPRNGSGAAFQKCLKDLGAKCGHPELSVVPWALWGHSGGGHWAGGMALLHPDRVVAAWLRSGVPLLKPDASRPTIKPHRLTPTVLQVPILCNLGTKEGVTVKEGRFAAVWPTNEAFFHELRSQAGLIGIAVDPLTAHECGNQRYLAIPWLDACLSGRLPKVGGGPLRAMPTDDIWLAPTTGNEAVATAEFAGDPLTASWLPNERVARSWMEYVRDTAVSDPTPPPAPTNVRLRGNRLTWNVEADLESGLAGFILERDGRFLANLPEKGQNPFGRPLFQNLQYSDTPAQPLIPLEFTDATAEPGVPHRYRIIAVNTVGLKSEPSTIAVLAAVATDERRRSVQTSPRADAPSAQAPKADADQTVDLLIQGGTVIDGLGQPGVAADVAIDAGRIVAVAPNLRVQARDTLDARGRIVCPGFIDLHSHGDMDSGILKFRAAENYIRQGVTTLVCGNCGFSPVEMAKFLERLRDGGTGLNIAMLIGHGSVRREVIGPLKVPASAEQLARMKRLVREAMQAGAVGLSTGLTYSPSAYGTTDEIVELAKEIAPFGGFYATHMRDEGTNIFEAMDEAFEIGRQAKVPVHISHHKISAASVFGLTRLSLQRIDEARSAGLDVTLDQYPYGAGSGFLSFYVSQAALSGGIEAYRRRIADPTDRAVIVKGVEEVFVRKLFEAGRTPDKAEHTAAALARVQVARVPDDPRLAGQNLTEILRARGLEVTVHYGAEVLVELVGRETMGINHTVDDSPGGDVDRVMQHPFTSIASDGMVVEFGKDSPHPRSYGCFPRVLGHYVRERKVLTLAEAIRKMTSLPAQRLGWKDRGVLAAGRWADVVVFDPAAVAEKATFLQPHQYSVGIDHVLVRGRFVLRAGQMTGDLPGQPVSRE